MAPLWCSRRRRIKVQPPLPAQPHLRPKLQLQVRPEHQHRLLPVRHSVRALRTSTHFYLTDGSCRTTASLDQDQPTGSKAIALFSPLNPVQAIPTSAPTLTTAPALLP